MEFQPYLLPLGAYTDRTHTIATLLYYKYEMIYFKLGFYFHLIKLCLLVSQNELAFLQQLKKSNSFHCAVGHCFTLGLAHNRR